MFRDSTFSESSLSASTPSYLWRAAPKQVQSIKMCLTVRGEWQIWHSGWFSPFRRYELVSLVWPIRRRLMSRIDFYCDQPDTATAAVAAAGASATFAAAGFTRTDLLSLCGHFSAPSSCSCGGVTGLKPVYIWHAKPISYDIVLYKFSILFYSIMWDVHPEKNMTLNIGHIFAKYWLICIFFTGTALQKISDKMSLKIPPHL